MRYWPTVNTYLGRVGKLVELPDTPEVMIAVREGLLVREHIDPASEGKETDDGLLRED